MCKLHHSRLSRRAVQDQLPRTFNGDVCALPPMQQWILQGGVHWNLLGAVHRMSAVSNKPEQVSMRRNLGGDLCHVSSDRILCWEGDVQVRHTLGGLPTRA